MCGYFHPVSIVYKVVLQTIASNFLKPMSSWQQSFNLTAPIFTGTMRICLKSSDSCTVVHVLFTLFVCLRMYCIVLSNTNDVVFLVLHLEDCSLLIAPSAVSNLPKPITLSKYCFNRIGQSVRMIAIFIYLTFCLIQMHVYTQRCCFKCVWFQHGNIIRDYVLHEVFCRPFLNNNVVSNNIITIFSNIYLIFNSILNNTIIHILFFI